MTHNGGTMTTQNAARGTRMADIGEPVRELEIPAQEPAWQVPTTVPAPEREPELVPA